MMDNPILLALISIAGWSLAIYYKYQKWLHRHHHVVYLDKNMIALLEDLMVKFDAASPLEVLEISIALLDMVTNEELINKNRLGFFNAEGKLEKFWALELLRNRKRWTGL